VAVKITSPGWHDGIASDDYHSGTICDGPSISASGLKRIALDCPAMYWLDSPYNPKREAKESGALDFGRAAHALVLGEPAFDAEFVVSPHADYRKDEAKKWRAAQTRTVVSAEDMRTIAAMVAEIKATRHVAYAFREGIAERSFFTKDQETGIWLKARPDWFPADPATRYIVEFKTAASVKPHKFGYQAFDLGYDIQAALMLDVVGAVLGARALGIAHVVQMKTAPYLVSLQYFTADQIAFGRTKYRAALRRFAECWERHKAGKPERESWPGYTTEPTPIWTPYPVAKEIALEAERTYHEPSTRSAA